jgi:CBS domain-containing protein
MLDTAKTTVEFLSRVKPFDLLPYKELENIANQLTEACFPKNALLFHQKISPVEYLYIVKEGKFERYIEEGGEKRLGTILGEGDAYGGISILLNRGMSVRSVQALENSTCYMLPKELFLELCSRYDEFTEHFTSTFGKRMLDRCYAAIIAKTAQTDEYEPLPGFLYRPIEGVYSSDFLTCDAEMPIQEAARQMAEYRKSYVLVKEPGGKFLGMVTDNDLRKKVVSAGYDIRKSVKDIMSSPLTTISARAQIFEAILMMIQHNIKHLPVVDEMDRIIGIASDQDLLVAQGHSPVFLFREIQVAKNLDEIGYRHEQLPGLVKSLLDSGARGRHVNKLITEISDAILKKVIEFALAEMGEPPARFAFMILGSEGRKEQTLKTDQDNAIVFEDVKPELFEDVQSYFLKLGEKVCGWLDEVGYTYCEFDIMAKNPVWCQPLKQWQKYFWGWIRDAEPIDLLKSSIFFDFRFGYGDERLVEDLRRYLFATLSGWMGFFRHLAENALEFKPPLDFFGKISLVSKGEHQNTVDIKSAMMLIVDFTRIYALYHKVDATNTLDRLQELLRRGVIKKQDHDDLAYVYSFLMQLRLGHQARNIIEHKAKPNNYINPKSLSQVERQTLKEAFKHLNKAQGKLSMDFSGWYTGIG